MKREMFVSGRLWADVNYGRNCHADSFTGNEVDNAWVTFTYVSVFNHFLKNYALRDGTE